MWKSGHVFISSSSHLKFSLNETVMISLSRGPDQSVWCTRSMIAEPKARARSTIAKKILLTHRCAKIWFYSHRPSVHTSVRPSVRQSIRPPLHVSQTWNVALLQVSRRRVNDHKQKLNYEELRFKAWLNLYISWHNRLSKLLEPISGAIIPFISSQRWCCKKKWQSSSFSLH